MIAARALRALADRFRRPSPVWDGIYAHAKDVPRSGPGFEGSSWLRPLTQEVESFLDARRAGRALPTPPADIVALARIVSEQGGGARVLDFGGGLGTAYLWVQERASVPSLEWTIVETPAVCEAGRAVHARDANIRFVPSLAEARGPFSLVHVRSALQYAEDWRATLTDLASLGAEVVALHKLSAGAVPTFASAQRNVRGTSIPYWFLNEAEIADVLRHRGYRLAGRSIGVPLPSMDNLPPAHRLTHTIDLVFRRSPD